MSSVIILAAFTFICLIISFFSDREKTGIALKRAATMLLNLLPPFFTILILISLILYLVPQSYMIKIFGKESGITGMILAAAVGSISLIPGFIAYPLSSILIKNGVSYSVIAVFITTLMMVGIVTIPIERKFFGIKITLMRNGLSFAGALLIGLTMAVLWSVI